LVGFGEAGFHIGRGLKQAGLEPVAAYDLNAWTPGLAERIRSHAEVSTVELVGSPEGHASRSDVLLSVVTAGAATDAARSFAPHLTPSHLYADLNSVSPEQKRAIASIVSDAGARFVEGTIMAPVAARGHRSPILVAGPSAPVLRDRMAPFGMQMEFLSENVGAASAVKLCRSIVVKGLEALMLECALAACHYGADDRVFDSLTESFPGLDWKRLAGYMVSRSALYGERRAREMEEAVEMLESIGIDPIMTAATALRQEWSGRQGLGRHFGGQPPEDYRKIVEAIRTKNAGSELRIRIHGE
jgi:3-hydroxyisobutyrate dehydrogenase-like beta-hydroxyacid dehydrogenase